MDVPNRLRQALQRIRLRGIRKHVLERHGPLYAIVQSFETPQVL